jgi:hypothetical protein
VNDFESATLESDEHFREAKSGQLPDSLRLTQAPDTATPQVRAARVDIASVIPSNARDPGIASGADSSP